MRLPDSTVFDCPVIQLPKIQDDAGNISATTWDAFTYKYDGTTPTNPATVSVSPAGYAASNSFTF